MEALSLHTGAPTVHWEDSTSCISAVEAKRVDLRVKHIDIPVYFLQEKFYNGLIITKYDNSSVMPADMCTKPCSGPIIIRSTECITEFRFYPTIKTGHYQLMRLHELIVK